MHLFCQCRTRITTLLTEIVIELLSALLRICINLQTDISFFLCTKDCKKSVRRDAVKRFRMIEVRFIFLGLRASGLLGHLGNNVSGLEYLTQCLADRSRLTKTFCNDVTGPGKSFLNRRHLFIHKSLSLTCRIHNRH